MQSVADADGLAAALAKRAKEAGRDNNHKRPYHERSDDDPDDPDITD